MIGVPKQTFLNLMNRHDYGDIVVVDLERKTFDSPFTDSLPPDAYNFLRNRLKSSADMFLSDGLSRSFLQANAILFGKYSLGFVKKGWMSVTPWGWDLT